MPIDASDFSSGRLVSELSTSTTTGVTVQMNRVNRAYISLATGQQYLYLMRKNETDILVEKVLVASGSTNNSTTGVATLGTLTRNISLTSGTDTTGSAATFTWPAGTLVYQSIGPEIIERIALLNEANTFSQEIDVTGNNNYVGLPSMTTANAPTYAAGRMYFDTTDNVPKIGVGGSFTNMTSGSVADASTTVAGKVEEATLSEISAGTAAGGTSARLFINPSHVKKNSTGAAEGNIPALNSSIALDTTIGGTGIPGGFTKGDILVATGSSTLVKLPVGSNGLALVADSGETSGLKYAAVTSTNYVKDVVNSGSDSASITHTGAAQYFTVYTYSIPANDLIAGVCYEIEVEYEMTAFTSGTPTWAVYLGTQILANVSFTPTGTSTGRIKARVYGTAAAGASVSVRSGMEMHFNVPTNNKDAANYATANVATNGALTLQLGVINGTGVTSILRAGTIRRSSTTAS